MKMDVWKLIIALSNLTDAEHGGSTEWTETEQRFGHTYTRTIKRVAALTIAARLLRAADAGRPPQRVDIERGKHIVQLAQWRRIEPRREGGSESPQMHTGETVAQRRRNFREIQRGRAAKICRNPHKKKGV